MHQPRHRIHRHTTLQSWYSHSTPIRSQQPLPRPRTLNTEQSRWREKPLLRNSRSDRESRQHSSAVTVINHSGEVTQAPIVSCLARDIVGHSANHGQFGCNIMPPQMRSYNGGRTIHWAHHYAGHWASQQPPSPWPESAKLAIPAGFAYLVYHWCP